MNSLKTILDAFHVIIISSIFSETLLQMSGSVALLCIFMTLSHVV